MKQEQGIWSTLNKLWNIFVADGWMDIEYLFIWIFILDLNILFILYFYISLFLCLLLYLFIYLFLCLF